MRKLNIDKEVAAMQRMTVDQLRIKYEDVFAEEPRSRHKVWLIKRIAWRMQANEEGDLSERARKRAFELANDADIRSTPPRAFKYAQTGAKSKAAVSAKLQHTDQLMPGSQLTRKYKGQTIIVDVLDDGFMWEGERYKSLTGVAKAVTGKHWNGFHFFNLRKPGAKQ